MLALLSPADATVIAALVGVLGTFILTWINSRKVNKKAQAQEWMSAVLDEKLDELAKNLHTNNGKTAGEYIEQGALAAFRLEAWALEHQQENATDFASVRKAQAKMKERINALEGGDGKANGASS